MYSKSLLTYFLNVICHNYYSELFNHSDDIKAAYYQVFVYNIVSSSLLSQTMLVTFSPHDRKLLDESIKCIYSNLFFPKVFPSIIYVHKCMVRNSVLEYAVKVISRKNYICNKSLVIRPNASRNCSAECKIAIFMCNDSCSSYKHDFSIMMSLTIYI